MRLLLPALILMLWTGLMAFRLGFLRYRAVAAREVDMNYYRLYRGEGEPDDLRKATRHLSNLYEAPPLFYALTAFAFVSAQTGTVVLALCWAYVVARLVHSLVHLGSNVVLRRFQVFALSWVILVALMIVLLLGVLGVT